MKAPLVAERLVVHEHVLDALLGLRFTAKAEEHFGFEVEDLDVAHAPLAEKSMDLPRGDEAEWVAVLEGSDAGAVGAAARAIFTLPRLKAFGVTAAPTVGTYRLLFGNQR